MNKKILIIDGHSLAYRAFYAVPPNLTLENGQPINAVYGFANMLIKSIEIFKPDYLAVCFDRKEPNFRHKMYDQYKAHRPPAPVDFISQVPLLHQILAEMKIKALDLAGYEADDLIGTLAKSAAKEGLYAMILTGDSDALQLVSENINTILNKRGISDFVIYTPEKVEERYGLKIDQLIDLKALEGDKSDNIPGVAGIGPKTATQLLQDFGNLENIYQNLDKIKSESVRNKLKVNKESAFLSRKLGTIDTQVSLKQKIEDFEFKPDWPNMLRIFKEYEFKNLIKKVSEKIKADSTDMIPDTHNVPAVKGVYTTIKKEEDLKNLIPKLKKGFAFDLETTAKHALQAQIVGLSLSFEEGKAYYLPLNKYLVKEEMDQGTLFVFLESEPKQELFQMNKLLALLQPVLEDKNIPKYTHNGKYEYLVLKNYGIELRNIAFDTILAAMLLYPGEKLGLKDLVRKYLNFEMTTYENVTGIGRKQVNFREVGIEASTQYASADADFTLRLTNYFRPQIKEEKLENLYYEMELPLQIVLGKMEFTGVSVDVPYLQNLEKEFALELDNRQKNIFELAGEPFNINSPKQLSGILFTKLKLPIIKKTKTGISTDSSVLEQLRKDYSIAEELMRYRELDKLQNTYVKALPRLVNIRSNKIHTSFNQTIVATGRLSSTNPNLQNIPVRSKEGIKIRKAFIPSKPENCIMSADYSQIELRIMAHLAQDENMIQAFLQGQDIHSSTASVVFNVPLIEVTKELRQQAKAINFGIVYGISAYGLARNLGIKPAEAKLIIDNYFAKFPKIKEFIDKTIDFAYRNEYVQTEFGRVRKILEMHIGSQSKMGERIAVNTRMQGTAADILKIAMIDIQKEMEDKKLKSRMIIQVHDELVFDIDSNEKEIMLKLVKEGMEKAVSFSIPLTTDIVFGRNWLEIS